ncbi:NAD(P)-dependent dehydrogenase (short-subunit alcohol dehydrogenase family) [Catenuloplanes nepalensis]|uniref:NAD(P)-dependent dehydrogenase (Short-subunit alcohol dehydrogenase family) n=1 Tax=Catenuloplanes nepalensis TaxID=587533 RepID=A0ABT9MTE1_9ACTN|nr:SDR family NAD(P)-dependent oxidoreductase [Catenuloplanes nepalensis]MDP9794538.1 NAD(P)-dependent dehydrogenase (short-subunit alcohol dehydrogenase family) [Catenuloplanes nepalensis]
MTAVWRAADIPDLSGRTAVVTGTSSGLGAVIAAELARHGAHVIHGVRDLASAPAGADARRLDLADLDVVAGFAASVDGFDVLVNNAGVMWTPLRRTRQGFEWQFGVNHLGHFALTALLWPRRRPGARVVTMSSILHRTGRLDLADPNWLSRRYSPEAAYAQSKYANVTFAVELHRRGGASLAAHPGYARTRLQTSGPTGVRAAVGAVLNPVFGQPAGMGALPALFAATSPDAVPGSFVGPSFLEVWGGPVVVAPARGVGSPELGERLWAVSEELTGVPFAV